jgi:hypothetical protein
MATYTITHAWRLDNYGVVQTLENFDGLIVGSDINISGLSQTNLNGNHVVAALEPYQFVGVTDEGDLVFDYDIPRPNQVVFADSGDDIDRTTDSGTLTYTPTCTWIDNDDVAEWLGIDSATANDTAFITTAVSAANAWCSRRRRSAGYFDVLNTAPSGDVKLGTVMYAAIQYRTRGSVDGYASFNDMGTVTPIGSLGQVLQLLGCGRPQIG